MNRRAPQPGSGLGQSLTPEQAGAVCREWASIGDRVFDVMSRLPQLGFGAFVPSSRLPELFCKNEAACADHRRYVVEMAKSYLGKPFPFEASPEARLHFFSSQYLSDLVAERDAKNGVSEAEVMDRYPNETWRMELDACSADMAWSMWNDSELFTQRHSQAVREQAAIVADEASRYVGQVTDGHSLQNLESRYQMFFEVMIRRVGPLGFAYDKKRSKSGFPVFSKAVGKGWDLCWAIEEDRSFNMSPTMGILELNLELRCAGLNGRLSRKDWGRYLIIRYRNMIQAFLSAYRVFNSMAELLLCVNAHLAFYELISSDIENGVRKVFGEPS